MDRHVTVNELESSERSPEPLVENGHSYLVERQPGLDQPKPSRADAILWKLQAYGLLGITFTSFFPRLFHYQEYLFFCLLAVALYLAWHERANLCLRNPIELPLLAFLGWVLCTVPFATDPAYSFSEWRKFVTHVLVLYWATFVLSRHRRTTLSRQVVWAVVAGSLALSSFALVDFVARGGTWRDRLVRAGAPSSDYNWLTTYLVVVIPVLIGWLLIQRPGRARTLGLLTLVASGFAQVAAYTRAGWVAHFAQAVGFAIMTGKQRVIVWVLVGTIAVGGGLVAISQIGYQRSTIDPWTLSARVKTWQVGLRQVVEHPVVGIGYGNDTFLKVHKAEIEAEQHKALEERVLPGLHNTFAMVLMGSGVPALVFFVWIMVRAIRELAPDRRQPVLRERGFLLLRTAIALAVIGFMVRNAFDYMFAGSLASLFWILVAVGFSVKDDRSLEKAGTE